MLTSFLKASGLRTLKSLGLFSRAAASQWRQDRLLILCYHGISLEDEHLWDPGLYISRDQFAARMQLLEAAKCNVLPLGEALRRLYAHELPPRSVALTFDDGYYDFQAQAFPILERHGFPVTVYLTTYYCEHEQPIFNLACRYILWKQQGACVPRDAGFEWDLDTRDEAARGKTFQAIWNDCQQRGLSGAEKDALLGTLAGRLRFDYAAFLSRRILQLLTPAETAQLASRGIDFELHTHRHRTPLDRALFRKEVEDNRDRLVAMTGSTPKHFCYPSGVVEREFLPWLQELGVISATTCKHGLAQPNTEPLLLPRLIDVSGMSVMEFEGWLTGARALLPSRH
ncbi:MAG TPA: polysaccharide deacetylase family protein [Bryobacteraceae bacterium]|nr:polysaccharide deacetylase family protein [Bryobacteraceae bacterium]